VRNRLSIAASMLAAASLLVPAVVAQTPAGRAGGVPARPPSLVVLLVVDQFRADYFEMYGKNWTGGLHELATRGAWFTRAAYPYASTKTCAGHATIGTGTLPMTHGMIDNEWFDPIAHQFTTCTEDVTSRSLVYGGKAGTEFHSAKWLRVPTLGDELVRQSGGRSRVAAMSLKARSTITLAGHGGPTTTAVWSEDTGGVWATSTAMAKGLSPDVDAYIRAHPVDVGQFMTWNRVAPEPAYQGPDQAPGEPATGGVFPHLFDEPIRTSRTTGALVDSWEQTPFTDGFLGGLAAHLLEKQRLGQQTGTDLLAVSFSATDVVGHRYGPKSQEIQDTLIRLDRVIGDLLRALDMRVGRDRYVLGFSSDHGVAILPEQTFPAAPGRGRGAGTAGGAAPAAAASTAATVADAPQDDAAAATAAAGGAAGRGGGGGVTGRLNTAMMATAIEALLDKQYGRGNYVEAFFSGYVYFRPGVLERIRKDPALMKAIEASALGIRGVAKVYWSADLMATTPTEDPILIAMRKSYVPGRSGDFTFVPERNWVAGTGSNHGTPYDYDTRVPVIFYGGGIAPGQYTTMSSPADIVPTIASMVRIKMPKTDGQILTEAIKK